MKMLVVLGHPDSASFNHDIARRVCETRHDNGHIVVFHDLPAADFTPLLTKEEIPQDGPVAPLIQRRCEELLCDEGISVIHSNWCEQPPAILKGWIDRNRKGCVDAERYL
ncbi:MAG: NAD(P)H-dependent oxidoreductase [Deltaproteobacteria bacterium]|nr:NAD(P)H-dependent oxidoreductase [Deltaproteobacteria bacterium]